MELRSSAQSIAPSREVLNEEADREIDRILAMSDDEILDQAIADGIDPEVLAAEMRAMFECVVKELNAPNN